MENKTMGDCLALGARNWCSLKAYADIPIQNITNDCPFQFLPDICAPQGFDFLNFIYNIWPVGRSEFWEESIDQKSVSFQWKN